jgi:hypothetical protein
VQLHARIFFSASFFIISKLSPKSTFFANDSLFSFLIFYAIQIFMFTIFIRVEWFYISIFYILFYNFFKLWDPSLADRPWNSNHGKSFVAISYKLYKDGTGVVLKQLKKIGPIIYSFFKLFIAKQFSTKISKTG